MAKRIEAPTRVEAHGNLPKLIDEYFGRVNSGTDACSIACMDSPEGWEEPGQMPEFDEYTVVLGGMLRVETREETFDVVEGQGVLAPRGEWVRYSSPLEGGAQYIAVCVPAFGPDIVHRDDG